LEVNLQPGRLSTQSTYADSSYRRIEGFIFYFESESAISKQMLEDRGVDVKRIAIMPVATIQEFRTQAVKILDKYLEQKVRSCP
jgi:hypothetical protein